MVWGQGDAIVASGIEHGGGCHKWLAVSVAVDGGSGGCLHQQHRHKHALAGCEHYVDAAAQGYVDA